MKQNILIPILLIVLFFASSAFAKASSVIVSILPQKYFVERIAGDNVRVFTLVGKGESPHTFEMTPKKMIELSGADLLFTIGISFEKALIPKIKGQNNKLIIVDSKKGISEIDAHDPHIWMNPLYAIKIAQNIRNGLESFDPANKDVYERNYKKLEKDLFALNKEILNELATFKNRIFLIYHPALSYFAGAYNLKQVEIEHEGKELAAKDLAKLIDLAKKYSIKTIFVEPQFSEQNAKKIASYIGATIVSIDPLAEDYIENSKEIASKIKFSFEEAVD